MEQGENESKKIVVLLDNFTRSEAQESLKKFDDIGGDANAVIMAPITEIVAAQNTEEALDAVAEGRWPGGTPRAGGRRSALIGGADKRNAVALSRAFRAVLPKDADPAFAIVTETGLGWVVDEYLKHIRKEHDYMKTADPSQDPDMREF